jgi:hypothetical protein
VETIATAFTDHFAVVLRLVIDAPLPLRGRGYWKMIVSLLQDATFMSLVETKWGKMAAKQEVLSQYRRVVGMIFQKNDASNIHSRRSQQPKGSSDTRKLL